MTTAVMPLGVKTLYTEPDSSWENGYSKNFSGKLHDELLNGDLFTRARRRQC